eukprot:1751719-Prymnesium_polylepis.1
MKRKRPSGRSPCHICTRGGGAASIQKTRKRKHANTQTRNHAITQSRNHTITQSHNNAIKAEGEQDGMQRKGRCTWHASPATDFCGA